MAGWGRLTDDGRWSFVPVVLMLCVVTGCGSIGPSTVNRDRFDYITAISESWKQQLLLNIVKLRYADTPVFLEVGQVISGYEVEGTFSAGGTIGNNSTRSPWRLSEHRRFGALSGSADRDLFTVDRGGLYQDHDDALSAWRDHVSR